MEDVSVSGKRFSTLVLNSFCRFKGGPRRRAVLIIFTGTGVNYISSGELFYKTIYTLFVYLT